MAATLGSETDARTFFQPISVRRYPRKWNHEFIDMPVVDKSKQNTPHFTGEVITEILESSKGYKQMVLRPAWWDWTPGWRSDGT